MRWAGIAWASPISALALLIAGVNCLLGGRIERRGDTLEATAGLLPWMLNGLAPRRSFTAITLGHVILARTAQDAARWRVHEREHVRQYERWGILFPAAYLGASFLAWRRGGDAYWDNRFEREARAAEFRAEAQAPPAPRPPTRIAARR